MIDFSIAVRQSPPVVKDGHYNIFLYFSLITPPTQSSYLIPHHVCIIAQLLFIFIIIISTLRNFIFFFKAQILKWLGLGNPFWFGYITRRKRVLSVSWNHCGEWITKALECLQPTEYLKELFVISSSGQMLPVLYVFSVAHSGFNHNTQWLNSPFSWLKGIFDDTLWYLNTSLEVE